MSVRRSTRSNIGKPPKNLVQIAQENSQKKSKKKLKKIKKKSPSKTIRKNKGTRKKTYKKRVTAPRPPALANKMGLDPYKYNKHAASFASYRGNFNPLMDPATAPNNIEYLKNMSKYHKKQAEILDDIIIKV